MKNKDITCILCPVGCDIFVEYDSEGIYKMEGVNCKSGKDYVEKEILNPERFLTATIKVINGKLPLVSVRSDDVMPKSRIFDVMKVIKKQRVEAPVKIGDIIISSNLLDLQCNIVATKNVDKK